MRYIFGVASGIVAWALRVGAFGCVVVYAVDDNCFNPVCVLAESGALGAAFEILVDVADSCFIRAVHVQIVVALRSGEQFLLRTVAKIGSDTSEHGCIFADPVISVSNGFVELGYSVR